MGLRETYGHEDYLCIRTPFPAVVYISKTQNTAANNLKIDYMSYLVLRK